MFECMLAFVGGMMFGAVGFLFIIALLVGGNPRHWRKMNNAAILQKEPQTRIIREEMEITKNITLEGVEILRAERITTTFVFKG